MTTKLERLIKKALKEGPPADLAWVYQDFYSPYYNLMRLLSASIKNGFLVELGVHTGRGLVSMSGNGNLIIGVDTNHHPMLDKMIAEHKNILFYNQPSLPVGSNIIRWANDRNYKGISLLHIDTEHSYGMAKAEFEAYKPYLSDGAYVLFDDLHAMDDQVLKYFNELPYYKIQDDRLHPICGYGVLIYKD